MAMLNARNSIRNPKTNTPEDIIFPTLNSLPSSPTDDRESPKLVPSNRLQYDLGSTTINDIPTSPSLPTTNMHRTEDTRFHYRNVQGPDEVHVLDGRVDHHEHASTASTWAKAEPLHSDVV
ncbi:uncharacterized protein LAESUDRAFT_423669 [Laetiporus sulphureus 93-53]|uniref:Uncharacterized protein n=1 Tax=Laetiporus sulphureus 93-53 TaxID=1314785 RepID=A0A165GIK2_9APHY|nr:uncharacterized protein LAESUDRAFT_423669 [Laetiporus sulphureus 93-53]KZT10396.1 hypothetical protein LAESUDRAFT_423669 [Laetiporus sulphureus 93-53]